MLRGYRVEELSCVPPAEFGDALECGFIVRFSGCPLTLPPAAELTLLREALPKQLKKKNVGYHPESDRVHGIPERGELYDIAHRMLKSHGRNVENFLKKIMPHLTERWTVGTSSFRPIQEKGRNLKPHASNELLHIDAGARARQRGRQGSHSGRL